MRHQAATALELIACDKVAVVGRPVDDVESDLIDFGLRVKRVSSRDPTTTLEYDPRQVRLIIDDDTDKVLRYACW